MASRRLPASTRLARLVSALLVLFAVVALAAYWTSRLNSYERLEKATLADMEQRAAALTGAVAEQTRSVVYNLDLALLHLQQQYRHFDALTVDDLKDVAASTPPGLVRRVTIIDAQGDIVLAEPPVPGPPANLADRPHFSVHQRDPRSSLYIGPPLQSRFTDEWLIPLSRRLTDKNGRFAGTALLVVAPEYFAGIYDKLAAGKEDIVALVRADGTFMSRNLNLYDHLGKSVRADRPFIGERAHREGVFRSFSTHEPVDRVFAWRRLEEWPLVVVIGLGVRETLASIHGGRHADLAATGAISTLVLALVAGVGAVLLRLGRNVVRLSETEERLAMAFAGASELAWEWNLAARQITFFGNCQPLLGIAGRQVRVGVGEWTARIPDDDREGILERTRQALRARADRIEYEVRLRHADDSVRWMLVRGRTVLRSEDGSIDRMIGIVLDVDAGKRAEMLAAQTRERYERLIENATEGIFVVDQLGDIEIFNPSAEKLLGMGEAQMLGTNARRLVVQPEAADSPPTACPVTATLADGLPRRQQRLNYRHADGHAVPIELSVAPTLVEGRTIGAVVVFADISERLAREAELENMARTDMLTGVANRRHFVEQCERELYRADRESGDVSLLMLDIDHFKLVNDRYGHAAGDATLVAVARQCVGELRQIDVFGRLGGEEFGAVLPGVGAGQARQVAERLRHRIESMQVESGPFTLQCTASFGFAARREGESLDALLARADHHLYAAKSAGRNRVIGDADGEDGEDGPGTAARAAVREA